MRPQVLGALVLVGGLGGAGALSAYGATSEGQRLATGQPTSRQTPQSPATPAQTSPPAQPHPSAPLSLPPQLAVGRPEDMPLAGDRALRVVHAPAAVTEAIVYLHGMCGNAEGADLFADLALAHGTLITVRADVPCPDRPGFKWPQDVSAIQKRIDAALAAVKEARGGLLDTDQVTLVGYSQGAHRAERLASASPQRYRRVALGGPPTSPTPEHLRHARAVAVLGGEREDTTHMMGGYLDLVSAGINAEFFLLPRSGHGSYGPEGRRVVSEVFDFLFSETPRSLSPPPRSGHDGSASETPR